MAKLESTAVNALIALPFRDDAEIDLFSEVPTLPPVRTGRGMAPARLAEIPALPRVARGTDAPPLVAPAPEPIPAAAAPIAEVYSPTAKVPTVGRLPRHVLWYAIPAVVIGSVGASLALRAYDARSTATPPPAAHVVAQVTPGPAPAPAARVVAPALAAPVVTVPPVIDVRFDSDPAGATVTLIENGRPRFLGMTPVVAGIDSSREAEVVFTGDGRDTQLAHFDPRAIQRVAAAPIAQPARPAPLPVQHRATRIARGHR